jgi:cyclic beta-1,2-glucan synthetase
MVNGWLPYQTLACRIWGRSALYQSGGAFGFRDQLQDASSLVHLEPARTREQILLHGSHQFVEGDVLHWWHPPEDIGLRTRFVDDLLWLPLLTASYIESTGDDQILEESLPLLQAPALEEAEAERFLRPTPSGQSVDLYEHCGLAIDRSLHKGPHGLPLFGAGDWNDGMNRVGIGGTGESVWMGFFLVSVIDAFLPFVKARHDSGRVHRYEQHRRELVDALATAGWDGEWYRRGYFDDGTPLGSRENDECRIDALAQAWAVLSGVAPKDRAESALDATERELVSEKDGLIRLLTPAFANSTHDPGYIKGYVAGVRENGGQYTHAALWLIRAFAAVGRRNRVARLLEMINPVNLSSDPDKVARYQLEPYVVAADVYGVDPHVGRGGWSWYTGSSGWMSRVSIESLLGFTVLRGREVRIAPVVPDDWPGFTIRYRPPAGRTTYEIRVENPDAVSEAVVSADCPDLGATVRDGAAVFGLKDDGAAHVVSIRLGKGAR